MTLCDKFKQIFKRYEKSPEETALEMRKDIQNIRFSEDDFQKKYKKRKEQDIKKIPALTDSEKVKAMGMAQILDEVNLEVLNLAPLIKRKYEIAYQYLREYQDALRKSMKKS